MKSDPSVVVAVLAMGAVATVASVVLLVNHGLLAALAFLAVLWFVFWRLDK